MIGCLVEFCVLAAVSLRLGWSWTVTVGVSVGWMCLLFGFEVSDGLLMMLSCIVSYYGLYGKDTLLFI